MKKNKTFDFLLFTVVLALVFIGIVMVFSASSVSSYIQYGDSYYFFKSQLKYALIGMLVMLVMSNINYKKWGKISPILLLISLIFLVMVRIPGIGQEIKGTWRWMIIAGNQFQPSELAKVSLILFLAFRLSIKKENNIDKFLKGLSPYLMLVGVMALLLLIEPHLSCTIIIIAVATSILICAGARIKHFLLIFGPVIIVLGVVVLTVGYMRARVFSFLSPFKYAKDDGYQVVQSLYAISSGGILGKGLGKSAQKFLYIPEPQNDFILAIIIEELGFLGFLAIVGLFIIFIVRGVRISLNAPDRFSSLVAVGITSLIGVQTIMNIAVVTSSMPPTGVSLPFLSYGGTSLVAFMGMIGILLNISKKCTYGSKKEPIP
jgi:cell division protein FtsW